MKSRLPTQTLAQIWELADIHHHGYLDATSFIIAMYLIQGSMSGTLKTIPATLPSSVYFDASPLTNMMSSLTITSPLSPTSSSFLRLPPAAGSSSRAPVWDVTGDLKATADEFFNVLDEQQKGYLEGKIARAHFLQSGLPEGDVRQIWYALPKLLQRVEKRTNGHATFRKLVDINGDGRLGRDEFAVALHLVQAKQDGVPLPATLPNTLIPPAMRTSTQEDSVSAQSLPCNIGSDAELISAHRLD